MHSVTTTKEIINMQTKNPINNVLLALVFEHLEIMISSACNPHAQENTVVQWMLKELGLIDQEIFC